MTRKELEQIYWYKKEIAMLEEQIKALHESCIGGSSLGDGMPHAKSTTSKTEQVALRAYELKNKLTQYKLVLFNLVKSGIDLIYEIPDSTTRMIVKYKCLDGLSMAEIGEIMGIDRTTCSKKYNAFMKEIS